MRNRGDHTLTRFPAGVFAAAAFLLALLPAPSPANIGPESALLIHVQPTTPSCETSIATCDQIVRSTTQDGLLEFVIFFMRGEYSWPGQHLCLLSLHAALVWPQGWEFVGFDPCYGWGWLNPEGSVHSLDMEWYRGDAPIPDQALGVFPVGRLWMSVHGQGTIGFAEPLYYPVELGCDSHFITQAIGTTAEAGMECGYLLPDCGKIQYCVPVFHDTLLALSAPAGEIAQGSADFSVYPHIWFCRSWFTVDPGAEWCRAEIDSGAPRLLVTADATQLLPGIYQTWVQVNGADGSSRCLEVVFTVEESPTPVERPTWGRLKTLHR